MGDDIIKYIYITSVFNVQVRTVNSKVITSERSRKIQGDSHLERFITSPMLEECIPQLEKIIIEPVSTKNDIQTLAILGERKKSNKLN